MVTMRQALSLGVACLSLALGSVSYGQEAPLGASLEGLLKSAKDNNPEFASMRFDAAAATERVVSASALPDPKFRTEYHAHGRAKSDALTWTCGQYPLSADAGFAVGRQTRSQT